MVGIDLDKGVTVIRVCGKRVKYMRGHYIGESNIRVNQLGEEYFLAHGVRVFMSDLYRKEGE